MLNLTWIYTTSRSNGRKKKLKLIDLTVYGKEGKYILENGWRRKNFWPRRI